MTLKMLDLFGGIGGFRLGLEQSDLEVETVAYYDNDKYAVKSYNEIFQERHDPVDVNELGVGEIPEHDILCAGFPCQSFSIAGSREGFEDTRGTLFFEIARIAKAKKPSYLLLENVKGLLSHDNGATFQKILETLGDLGYFLEWQVLNSRRHGVPQNRERVFIVGHLGGEPRRKVFPITGETGKDSGQDERRGVTTSRDDNPSVSSVSTAVDANYYKGIDNHGARTAILDWHGHENKPPVQKDVFPTLRSESHGHQPKIVNHQERPESRPSISEEGQSLRSGLLYNQEYSYALSNSPHFVTDSDDRGKLRVHRDDDKKSEIQGYSAFLPSADYVDLVDNHDKNLVEPVMTPDFESKNQNKKGRVGSDSGAMFTVDGTSIHGVTNGTRIRKLTPLETWRLQGFPDTAFQKAEKVNSDTQLYKQAGNAVTTNVVKDIGDRLAEVL